MPIALAVVRALGEVEEPDPLVGADQRGDDVANARRSPRRRSRSPRGRPRSGAAPCRRSAAASSACCGPGSARRPASRSVLPHRAGPPAPGPSSRPGARSYSTSPPACRSRAAPGSVRLVVTPSYRTSAAPETSTSSSRHGTTWPPRVDALGRPDDHEDADRLEVQAVEVDRQQEAAAHRRRCRNASVTTEPSQTGSTSASVISGKQGSDSIRSRRAAATRRGPTVGHQPGHLADQQRIVHGGHDAEPSEPVTQRVPRGAVGQTATAWCATVVAGSPCRASELAVPVRDRAAARVALVEERQPSREDRGLQRVEPAVAAARAPRRGTAHPSRTRADARARAAASGGRSTAPPSPTAPRFLVG